MEQQTTDALAILAKVDGLEKLYLALVPRIDSLERSDQISDRNNKELLDRTTRLDERIKYLSEQGLHNNDAATKATNELRMLIKESEKTTQELVAKAAMEISQAQDKIISCLGINESPDAAADLRMSLLNLRTSWKDQKELTMWVKRGVITLILGGVGLMMWAGFKALLLAHGG